MDPLQVSVSALLALTKPLGNTKMKEPVWFHCTVPTSSMHRTDGKKLPFVNGFFKAEFQEDYDYLNQEVETGNPYILLATPDQVAAAKMKENPKEAIREQVKAEVENNYSIEDLEKLLQKRREIATAAKTGDAAKLGGVDKPKQATDVVQAVTSQPQASQTGANTAGFAAAIKV